MSTVTMSTVNRTAGGRSSLYSGPDTTGWADVCPFDEMNWKRIRHFNFIKRTFGESRQCVKVTVRLHSGQSRLSLLRAVLNHESLRGRCGVEMTLITVCWQHKLRRELLGARLEQDKEMIDKTVTAAASDDQQEP